MSASYCHRRVGKNNLFFSEEMTETHRCFVVSTQFNNLLPEQNPTRYSDEQILDLSRFDAAPLIAFTVTKETDYGTATNRRI